MIQSRRMLKVRPINGKLIIRIQHSNHGEIPFEWIGGIILQHEHPVIQRRAVELAEHCILRRWVVGVGRGCDDDIPAAVDLVEFRSPDVGRVGETHRWG